MTALRKRQIHTLANSATFRDMSTETLARLAAGATESIFDRGSVIFGRGDRTDAIHVVVSGNLKLAIETLQGDEHVVDIVQEGDSFGEAAALTGRPHLVTAAAISNCRLLNVTRSAVLGAIALDPALTQRMIQMLSDSLYRRTSDMENVLCRTAPARVARFIIDQLGNQGERCVRLPARKGLIASRLNMTQEHFSRTLRLMISRGEISVSGMIIIVLNEAGLRQLAN